MTLADEYTYSLVDADVDIVENEVVDVSVVSVSVADTVNVDVRLDYELRLKTGNVCVCPVCFAKFNISPSDRPIY